ncbi:Uncharacterized protein HZ326_6236 [Fusarium oxysporum f. sp. albedinis]|nr:Uncharacterized protein HZ326_6236 [Fusarium oxysporum f. sp. albedinis]
MVRGQEAVERRSRGWENRRKDASIQLRFTVLRLMSSTRDPNHCCMGRSELKWPAPPPLDLQQISLEVNYNGNARMLPSRDKRLRNKYTFSAILS